VELSLDDAPPSQRDPTLAAKPRLQQLCPGSCSKLGIKVSGTLGTRTGEAVTTQTHCAQAHPDHSQRGRYKNRRVRPAAGGGAAAVVIAAVLLTRQSGSGTTFIITPGLPVFQ
jgi:hypothetical protein